ncbi:MAG: winged helix-turn-helix transcriptional regulator [Promethearchaeota archaeon]
MDAIDKGILFTLLHNCRVTFEELARDHKITANAIKRRVAKLHKSGVIYQFIIRLSWKMVDAHPLIIFVYSDRSYDDEGFMNHIGAHPMVSRVRFDSFGSSVVTAAYRDGNDIYQLSEYLQNLEGVNDIEIHTIPADRGEQIKFTRPQYRVMTQLAKDPRMPISLIASQSGLSAKRVSKTINELENSKSLLFTIDIDPAAGAGNFLAFRIIYQPKVTNPKAIISSLEEEFHDKIWDEWHSASQNRLWINCVLDNVREAEPIAKRLRMMAGVEIENTIVPYPARYFPNYRDDRLQELLQESGVLKISK